MKRFDRAKKYIEDPNLQIMQLNKYQAKKWKKRYIIKKNSKTLRIKRR